MGIVRSERNLSHRQIEEMVSFLKINLSRKTGKERKEIFFAVNSRNFRSLSAYYLDEIRKVFSHIFFPKKIRKEDVDRLLRISLNSVKRDYYFSEAMKIAKEEIMSGRDVDLISELIYDIQGPELSEDEREKAVMYACHDYRGGLRRAKKLKTVY